ncbi:MAG: hypothetical protein DMG79_00165 [Acidobacteria bacterium]|nr:MAG: hypothetical protein DMG79_00165 [Acidobacteriota bacterium]
MRTFLTKFQKVICLEESNNGKKKAALGQSLKAKSLTRQAKLGQRFYRPNYFAVFILQDMAVQNIIEVPNNQRVTLGACSYCRPIIAFGDKEWDLQP